MEADIDCSGTQFPARLVLVGDFDGDGLTEVAASADADTSAGNDFWVMKYDAASGSWRHMAPIANQPIDADIDCSNTQFSAKLALVADFDGDGCDEIVVAPKADGSRGNDLWVMKFDRNAHAWRHMAPIPNHAMEADIDCASVQFAAKLLLAGDFDNDGRAELVVVPDAAGSRGNDIWVMKYVGDYPTGEWRHMAQIPNHPMEADIDCSPLQFATKLAVIGDFDGDGHDELVVVPDAQGSRGNDLWVMKYIGRFPRGHFVHMAPIQGHPMDADVDCSNVQFPAKLALAADFDHDDRDELVVVPNAQGSRGNDLWVMKYVGDYPNGVFKHMAPIANHAMEADIDCSGLQFAAKFAGAADLDNDQRAELVVAPDTGTSRGNDLWVMKYVGDFPNGVFKHMAPIPGHPMDADIDCSGAQFPAKSALAADFDRDGVNELVVVPEASGSDGNNLWAIKFSGGAFEHMTAIAGSSMDADVDCSSREFPAKVVLAGNFDGAGAELLVTPATGTSRGNDFWVLGLKATGVAVVDIVPNTLSGETNQDSEPNIAVNPSDPRQIAASAFTSNPGGTTSTTAPIYVSSDGGSTWVLNNIVPSAESTHDITLRFASKTNNLYAGILRAGTNVNGTRDILRTSSYTGSTAMTLIVTQDNIDQPYVEAASVTLPASAAPVDRVFVGNEDRALFGPNFNGTGDGRTATIDVSQDAGQTAPSGFTHDVVEQRAGTIRNGPPTRPAVHPDGTVYAIMYRWTKFANGAATTDVAVVRDDNWGASTQPFQSLVDGGDNTAGVRVVTGRTLPFTGNSSGLGQERLVGSNLSIAVDPRDSGVVYIAWADRVATDDYTLHVRRSADRGATWSADLRTVTNATNPALAVNGNGKVAFLYQALTGSGADQRWDTHVELTTSDWKSPPEDLLLATVPADTPTISFFPYIGDYVHVMAVGTTFYGVFSANNTPDKANFPHDVSYQRNADFTNHVLLDTNNVTPVAVSIDPFFFKVTTS